MDVRASVIVCAVVALIGNGCGGPTRPVGGSAGFGEPCVDNGACASSLCLASACTSACASDCACPAGYGCVAASASLSVCAAGPSTCRDAGAMCAAREAVCTGGRDDDCDGTIDCADIDCSGNAACGSTCTPAPETSGRACTNGADDDCDGVFDCLDPDCGSVGACLGDYVPDDCTTSAGDPYDHAFELVRRVAWTLSDLRVELTADGFRTVMLVPRTLGGTITLTSTARAARDVDLQAPPNEYFATCTDCFVLAAGGRTYFQRRGGVTYTSVPTAIGERLEGGFWAYFDEVTLVAGEYQLVPGGSCIVENASFSGVAVSGGVSGSGGGSLVGGGLGLGFGSHTPTCGDAYCDANETPDSCDADCPCSPSAFTLQCPGGHFCPRGSDCVSRGRCACGFIAAYNRSGAVRNPLSCDDGADCTASTCTDASWGCMYLDSSTCGWNAWVPCGDGVCPAGSMCAGPAGDEYCECNVPGGTWLTCDGALCSGVAGGCTYPDEQCAVPAPP